MRTAAEDPSQLQLTEYGRAVRQITDANHGASLGGTELWHHAAYAWSYVAMAHWLRSVYSASHHEETLFIVAAQDYIINVYNKDLRASRDALLKIPNMNTTGRIPAVAGARGYESEADCDHLSLRSTCGQHRGGEEC